MRLHEQAKHYKAKAFALEVELYEVMIYLYHEKFSVDTNVNKNDIILRIMEARKRIDDEFTVKEDWL